MQKYQFFEWGSTLNLDGFKIIIFSYIICEPFRSWKEGLVKLNVNLWEIWRKFKRRRSISGPPVQMLLFPNALCCSLYERSCVCAVTKTLTKFLPTNNFCQLLQVKRKRSCISAGNAQAQLHFWDDQQRSFGISNIFNWPWGPYSDPCHQWGKPGIWTYFLKFSVFMFITGTAGTIVGLFVVVCYLSKLQY